MIVYLHFDISGLPLLYYSGKRCFTQTTLWSVKNKSKKIPYYIFVNVITLLHYYITTITIAFIKNRKSISSIGANMKRSANIDLTFVTLYHKKLLQIKSMPSLFIW